MVKILFIYPNAEGYFRIPLGLCLIMTILMNEGHEVKLFDTTFMIGEKHIDNVIRERANLVQPIDTAYFYSSKVDIDHLLRKKISGFDPDVIGISFVEDNYQYGNHLLNVIKDYNPNVPVVAGGSTPTVAPEIVIENPFIDFVVQGEGEATFLEFCNLMECGKSVNDVRNLWYKNNGNDGNVKQNKIRPFIDMDTLPILNLELWDKYHFMKPYCGTLRRAGFFEMARGCPNRCSYCINYACRQLLRDAGHYHRMKSIEKLIEEIHILKDKHNFEMILFCDDNFLRMPQKKMDMFTQLWKKEIDLPFWLNTTVETVNDDKLRCLKESGCCGIGIGIESGSEPLRKAILKRRDTNQQIERAFNLIHRFDIRTTANSMLGFPDETEKDFFETVKLNRKVKPKSFEMNFVAPYIGTEIHRVALERGLIDVWDKPGFQGMAKDITTRRHPVIRNENMTEERMMELYYNFVNYVRGDEIEDICI